MTHLFALAYHINKGNSKTTISSCFLQLTLWSLAKEQVSLPVAQRVLSELDTVADASASVFWLSCMNIINCIS